MADGTLPPLARRKFLLGATVTAAGAFAEGKRTVAEQPAGERAPPLKIIDFHNHYVGPNFPLATLAAPRRPCDRIGRASIATSAIQARSCRRLSSPASPPG